MASSSATNYHPEVEDECSKELHNFLWSCESSLISEVITDPEQPNKEVRVYRDCNSEHKLPTGDGEFVIEKEDPKLPESISKATTAIIAIKLDQSDGQDLSDQNSGVMRIILGTVWRKLVCNPNSYSSVIGIIWVLIAARFHIGLPPMVQGSVTILSNAGLGMAMFSLGLFMALQPRIIACGASLALLAMLMRFLAGPAFMAIASIAAGLRGTVLHLSIVQEYGMNNLTWGFSMDVLLLNGYGCILPVLWVILAALIQNSFGLLVVYGHNGYCVPGPYLW